MYITFWWNPLVKIPLHLPLSELGRRIYLHLAIRNLIIVAWLNGTTICKVSLPRQWHFPLPQEKTPLCTSLSCESWVDMVNSSLVNCCLCPGFKIIPRHTLKMIGADDCPCCFMLGYVHLILPGVVRKNGQLFWLWIGKIPLIIPINIRIDLRIFS